MCQWTHYALHTYTSSLYKHKTTERQTCDVLEIQGRLLKLGYAGKPFKLFLSVKP